MLGLSTISSLRRVALLALSALLFACSPAEPLLEPAGTSSVTPEASGATSTWYLSLDGERFTLVLGRAAEGWSGELVDERTGERDPITWIAWGGGDGSVALSALRDGGLLWVDARVVRGVVKGRWAKRADWARPSALEYGGHVTGWSPEVLDEGIVPRVFELTFTGGERARLRIDEDAYGLFAHFKVYATVEGGSLGERLTDRTRRVAWDGQVLGIELADRVLAGEVDGRRLIGTARPTDGRAGEAFTGARAEVLGYGLASKPVDARDEWQKRTRAALLHLMMAPVDVETATVVRTPRSLIEGATSELADRDDDPEAWPRTYSLEEITTEHVLTDRDHGARMRRATHGYLARPPGDGPWPAVVAVNGHNGSAWQVMSPRGLFWYGDAFARRGFVVYALDVSHRRPGERGGLYGGVFDGDDPAHGNHAHPAIARDGFDSDFEEDGERVFDVMRAVDQLLALPEVDPSRILVTGLSMGGELATFAAALDPRLAASVPAGFSPDLGVVLYNGNHPCWAWAHADLREYIDVSDLHALIAPRPLIVETGTHDVAFSALPTPFAGDKQVAARSRVAYGDEGDRFLHYLHHGAHVFHAGDRGPSSEGLGVTRPIATKGSEAEPDARTVRTSRSLFGWLDHLLR